MLRKLTQVLVEQGLFSVSNFLISILMVKVIGGEKLFPEYFLAFSAGLIVFGLIKSGFFISYTVDLAKTTSKEKKRIKNTIAIHVISVCSITILILSFVFVLLFLDWKSVESLYSVFFISTFIYREGYRSVLQSNMLYREMIFSAVFSQLILLIFIIYIWYISSLEDIVLILSTANLFSVIFMRFMLKNYISHDIKPLSEVVSYCRYIYLSSKWYLAESLIIATSTGLTPWVVVAMLDRKSLLIYGVITMVGSILQPLVRGYSSFILPYLSHLTEGNRMSQIWKTFWPMSIINILFLFMWYIYGDDILKILYGDQYGEYSMLVILIIMTHYTSIISSGVTAGIQSINKSKYIARSQLVGFVLFYILTIPLMYYFHLVGLLTGILITSVFITIYRYRNLSNRF